MSKTAFDDQTRRELRGMLQKNGVAADRAGQIVDLACHAADSAVDTLFDTCKRSGDVSASLMAIELALQLASCRMQAICERAHDLGRASGAPQYEAKVGMAL